ncbi:MAG: EamA-like transporter family [Patescibacteria group bacterium]|nr:EamA-like transporter family [Patescibacteria group bacterium]
MNWLTVALTAYLLLAIANLLDKFLVDNVLKSSKAYAFINGIMGLLVFVAAPWFLNWPGFFWFSFNIFSGFLFALALWSLYESLKRGDASRVLVFIGGLTPLFSILFSIILFQEKFSVNQWFGMGFMLLGVLLIAFLPQSRNFLWRFLHWLGLKKENLKAGLDVALASAFFYSLYFIATKYAYSNQPFVSTFLWTRLGAAIFVSFFLFNKKNRADIYDLFKKKTPTKNQGLVVFNQALGSGGFLLQNYAISLGSVAIINALQGFQYAFLLIISSILAVFYPKLLKETFSWPIILQKTGAVLLIGVGLYFIALS